MALGVRRSRPCWDLLGQRFDPLGQRRVLVEQPVQQLDSFARQLLPIEALRRDGLPVLGVGLGMRLVAIRLPGLGEQDQRGGIGGLEAERQVEQDERIDHPYVMFYRGLAGADLGFCRQVEPGGGLRSWLRWLRSVEAERDGLAEQLEYAALFRGRC